MICPDLILHNYYSKDSDSSLFSTPVVPCPQWDCLPTEQIRYAWGSCVTRQNLGLCDMNCYSVNGSPASQGGIPMGGISQIKTEQFLFIVESASPSMSLLSLHFLCANKSSCAGQPASLHSERGVTGLRVSACSLPRPGKQASCELEGAVPA